MIKKMVDDDEYKMIKMDCCEECIKCFQIQPRKDKKFIEDITNYFKQKVMLKEIEK